jgi:3-hydroxyisobutyrate dehydrogenase-like beta-hydroxyacid dehydrogenase
MQLKDLNIVMDSGETYDAPLPLSAITRNLFQAMVEAGDGELDNAAVLSVLENLANVHVGP